MMRLRRASVITALSLLAWAATASAECAWVLWTQLADKIGSPDTRADEIEFRITAAAWNITGAYKDQSECVAEETKSNNAELERQRREWKRLDVARTRTLPRQYLFQCLPDTVDPRGPKGK